MGNAAKNIDKKLARTVKCIFFMLLTNLVGIARKSHL